MNRFRTLPAGILLVFALTACATPDKKLPEVDANGKKIEYVYYTPVGTSIPIKVRKDSLKVSDSDAAAQDKAYTDVQRDSIVSPPPTPGGK